MKLICSPSLYSLSRNLDYYFGAVPPPYFHLEPGAQPSRALPRPSHLETFICALSGSRPQLGSEFW